jgi:hypothetical protein
MAVCPPTTLPTVAKKVADEAPGATVTLAGTVTAALLLESVTTVVPETTLLRFTVQPGWVPLVMFDGLQLKEVTCSDAATVTVTVVCADPL